MILIFSSSSCLDCSDTQSAVVSVSGLWRGAQPYCLVITRACSHRLSVAAVQPVGLVQMAKTRETGIYNLSKKNIERGT